MKSNNDNPTLHITAHAGAIPIQNSFTSLKHEHEQQQQISPTSPEHSTLLNDNKAIISDFTSRHKEIRLKRGFSDVDNHSIPMTQQNTYLFKDASLTKDVLWLIGFIGFALIVPFLHLVQTGDGSTPPEQTFLLSACFLAAPLAILYLVFWIFAHSFRPLLLFLQGSSVVFLFISSIASVSAGYYIYALIWLVLGISSGFWLLKLLCSVTMQSQLQFCSFLLQLIGAMVQQNKVLVVLLFVFSVVQELFLAWWSYIAVKTFRFQHFGIGYFYVVVLWFWVTQIFKTIVNFAVSESLLRGYFKLSTPSDDTCLGNFTRKPVIIGIRRALTSSLGSICKGSLIEAPCSIIAAGLRFLSKTKRFHNSFCTSSVREKLRQASDFFHKFANQYAFGNMILHGQDYSTSARKVWSHFMEHGIDVVVYDDELSTLLWIPCIGTASFVSSVSWILSGFISDSLLLPLLAFFIGFSSTSLTTEVMVAGLASIFVGFSEESKYLLNEHPLLFHRLVRIAEFGQLEMDHAFQIGLENDSLGDSGDDLQ